MSEWIKCSDRLPDTDRRVLVVISGLGHESVHVDRYGTYRDGFWDGWKEQYVTHWAELPPPPEDKQ